MSQTRLATENLAILAPLGVIVAWLVSLLPVVVPADVQAAIASIVVGGGNLLLSDLRNRAHLTKLVSSGGGLVVVALLATGCVSWDGATYKRLAGDEIVAILSTTPETPISAARCEALIDGAIALRDGDGESSSLNAPFLAGQHIGDLADRHERLAALCVETFTRDAARGLDPVHRTRTRGAWVSVWQNGRALQGGVEEEEID